MKGLILFSAKQLNLKFSIGSSKNFLLLYYCKVTYYSFVVLKKFSIKDYLINLLC